MNPQMTFLDRLKARQLSEVEYDGAKTIQARFERFHKANPEVYTALRRLALDLKAKGREKYGIKSLFEILRWHYAMATIGTEFKMPNEFTSRYARFLMEKEPELEDFFRTSVLRAP